MKFRYASLVTLALLPALLAGCGNDSVTGTPPDTTPPLAPVVSGVTGDQEVIGLWWESNAEPDLAGYFVYARSDGTVKRVNQIALTGNYFTFRAPKGKTVTVYMTAIDWSGNESAPSSNRRVPLDGAAGSHFLPDNRENARP